MATTEADRRAIVSYATAVASTLVAGVTMEGHDVGSAASLRELLLRDSKFVALGPLLAYCWSAGIAVVSLKVFPLRAKRMSAVAIRLGSRHVILVGRESRFPAQMAYYIAHELGHIALGHLSAKPALVDLGDPLAKLDRDDSDEVAADRFALELLTGEPEPRVLTRARRYSASALANAATEAGIALHIEPGTLALCFGHTTGRWDKVTAALKLIYPDAAPLSGAINRVAMQQVEPSLLPEETLAYLGGAIGQQDG